MICVFSRNGRRNMSSISGELYMFIHQGAVQIGIPFRTCFFKRTADASFCGTQSRHSVKTRLCNSPSPIPHSVKRSDVRWLGTKVLSSALRMLAKYMRFNGTGI